MKSFIEWLIKMFRKDKPAPKPAPTPVPVPEPEKPKPETPDDDQDVHPQALHGPVYSCTGATIIAKREGQFVCNPESSKGTAKFILPNRYTHKTYSACLFVENGFHEDCKQLHPHEYNDRERWHGRQAPSAYPKGVWLRWNTNDNGTAKDYCYFVKDVNAREG